jgi:hypothetical protein
MLHKWHSQRHILNPWLKLSFATRDYFMDFANTVSIDELWLRGQGEKIKAFRLNQ